MKAKKMNWIGCTVLKYEGNFNIEHLIPETIGRIN